MAKLTVSATKPLVWPEMDRSNGGVEGDLRRRRFGRGRNRGCGARRGAWTYATGSWEHVEDEGVLGFELTRLWPRRRQWLSVRARGEPEEGE